jgi:pantothenate kinase-related protein Tda10
MTPPLIDLSLQRGYFCLGNYVTLDTEQREHLLQTLDSLYAFITRKEPRKRPYNIFIEALPGSGKSFLAEQFKNKLEVG